MYWLKKHNSYSEGESPQRCPLTLLFITFVAFPSTLFSSTAITQPEIIKKQCLECHSISSADLIGGTAGGDLSIMLQRSKPFGGVQGYIKHTYKTDHYRFFLYPSNYVPQMAVVEGKMTTTDIDNVVLYLDSLSKEPKFMMRTSYWIVLVMILAGVVWMIKRRWR